MKKYIITSLAGLVLAAIFWPCAILSDIVQLFIPAILSSIIFVCFGIICIMKTVNGKLSAYLIFAVTDTILGLMVAAYAVYDIMTDTGWFAGLLGMLLLFFVIPIFAVLLVIDFLLWYVNRKKSSKKTDIKV